MESLQELRSRMKIIEQTLQVTRAMNLISASKLRKGRKLLADTEPFFNRIQKTMGDILVGRGGEVRSRFLDNKVDKLVLSQDGSVQDGPEKHSAILMITGDKGMAGGYNVNVFREVNRLCAELSNPVLILAGDIGSRYFINSSCLILENFSFQSRLPDMNNARKIAEYIISQYSCGMFGEVRIVYTHMYNAVKLIPMVKQLLPLSEEKLQEEIVRLGWKKRVGLNFEYEPSEEAVFDALAPMYIKGVIYGCLVEAYASEQSARQLAMDEAGKNARDMLNSLRVQYSRIRQAKITQEMTEILSGSAALE